MKETDIDSTLIDDDENNQNEREERLYKEPKNLDENEILIPDLNKNEKSKLAKILLSLNQKLIKEENQSINDAYKVFYKVNELSKREIKNNLSNFLINIMFYIISPLFTIINLIGIFEIKSIMNALLIVLKNSIINGFKKFFHSNGITLNFNEDYNFYNIFLTQSIDIAPDFDLIMIMNFFGFILLKTKGFKISSIVFLLINCVSISLIYFFNFNDYNDDNLYSFSQIIYQITCIIILFIGVGASALLSQQILIDSFLKLKSYLNGKNNKEDIDNNEEINENKQNKEGKNIGSGKKKVIQKKNLANILKANEKKQFDFFFIICINTFIAYFIKYLLSLFIYKKKYDYDNIEMEKFNMSLIDNNTLFENIYNHDKTLFFPYTIIIYVSSIFLSVVIYWVFTCIFKPVEKEKKNEDYNIYNIFGFIIYSQKIKNNNKNPSCECLRLFCKSFKKCYEKIIIDTKKNDDIKCNCLCCYCCKFDSVDYEKNEEFF